MTETTTRSALALELLTAAVAMSLYRFNVSRGERAEKLYHHFKGQCAELEELLAMVDNPCWATEMPHPTALVYLRHALERYGNEAAERVQLNHAHERGFIERLENVTP